MRRLSCRASRSGVRDALCAVAVLALCASCIAPSDPALPPLAVRNDDGTLFILAPACPAAGPLTEIEVTALYEAKNGDVESGQSPVFSASKPLGGLSREIELGPRGWEDVDGSYDGQKAVVIVAFTDNLRFVSELTLKRASGLPAGNYLVRGEAMSAREYQQLVNKELNC